MSPVAIFRLVQREGRNKLLRIRVEESVVRLLKVLRGAPKCRTLMETQFRFDNSAATT
jgi:hypothetical protein